MKHLLLLVVSGVCFSAVAGVAGVEVVGKGSMSLGEPLARVEAINNALVEASYRNNSFVSAVTEVKNLAINESSSIVKTSSVIDSYKVLDEGVCDNNQYCVTISAQFGEKVDSAKTLVDSKMFLNVSFKGAASVDERECAERFKQSLILSLNGLDNLSLVDDPKFADVTGSLNLSIQLDSKSKFNFLYPDSYKLVGDIFVSNPVTMSGMAFDGRETFTLERGGENLLDVTSEVVSKLMSLYANLPHQDQYLVSTLEGDKLFLKSSGQKVGSVFEISFEDLSTNSLVSVIGVVRSVYKDDVILQLGVVPPPSYRVRRINKIAN